MLAIVALAPAAVASPPAVPWFTDSFGSYDPGGYGLALQNCAPNWQSAPEGSSNSQLRVVNYTTYGEGPDYDADGNYVEFKGDSHVGNDNHVQTAANWSGQSAGKVQIFHLRARPGMTPFPGTTGWYHASFGIRDAANSDIACWAGGSLGLKSHLVTAPIVYPGWDSHYYGILPAGWVGGPTPTDTTPGAQYLFPDADWHDFDITYDPSTGVTKWFVDKNPTPIWTQTQAAGRAMNKIWVRDVCVKADSWAWEDHVYVDEVSVGTIGVPTLNAPAGGAQVNTLRPMVAWATAAPDDPTVAYQVKICSTDSPTGTLVYDSGTVSASATLHAVGSNLPTAVTLYAFVKEQHAVAGWTGWSATGSGGFTVSTSLPGPGPVVSFTAIAGNAQNILTWRNPGDASCTGTLIRYRTNGYPSSPTDGSLAIDKPGGPNADDAYTHTSLTNGTTYYYAAFAHDSLSQYATQLFASATPAAPDVTPPSAVTKFKAVKGDGEVLLSWRNPSAVDFTAVMVRFKTTGYPTSKTDGALVVDEPGTRNEDDSYTHTGTNNGLTYYYSAFAHDGVPNYSAAANATAYPPETSGIRIHPDNPHYFQDIATGKPVMITSFSSIVPSDTSYDYVAGIAEMQSRRIDYSRVWHFLPWAGVNAVWPWGRSGVAGAPMGGNKIDMNTWNSTYWTRMNDAMSRAATGGTIGEIHLFDRCGMSPAGPTRWQGNPWATNNNINNLETPTADLDGTPEFYDYENRPNLRNQQERYIRKMIDETIQYTNIIYEVENEHWELEDPTFGAHYAQFIKDYIASAHPGNERLVTYNSLMGDIENFFNIDQVDIVNMHFGGDAEADTDILNAYCESRWPYNKAVNIDEFANGVGDWTLLRKMCWIIVTSGGNFHIEDANAAVSYDVCENIRSFKAVSGWDFIRSHPEKELIVSGGGYCMAQIGVEYVYFFPAGGGKAVTLPAGTYRAEWWDTRTGGFSSATTFSHAGGNKVLNSPDYDDWVLHIVLATDANPPAVLESKYSGPTAIDGNPADWNISQFTTKIPGGDVGSGQIAVVGYDTNGVCYSGSHSSGLQFPPANAADHAVKIYSRHDDSYLYLLVRCDDSDMRYPNLVDSNWANDCIEIYIDPSHNHGSNAINNSTSDVQLVIDANNQEKVYCTTAGYATQVQNGVTSAVVRDGTGWWLELSILKSALDPDIPSNGTIGIDFNLRDNDNNNDSALTTLYTWTDPLGASIPSKVPDRWGDLNMLIPADVTPPGPVTAFGATGGAQQVSLSWTNPSDSDFTGTAIRYKTGAYPTSLSDGSLVVDKSASPGSNDNFVHGGLVGGTTYYYSAWAHDAALNYSVAKADASATTDVDLTPPGPITNLSAAGGNAQIILSWRNPSDTDYTGAMVRYKTSGYPVDRTDGPLVIDKTGSPGIDDNYTHTSLINGTTYYYSVWAHDSAGNYSVSKTDVSGAPSGVTVATLNVKKAGGITVNGGSSDWNLSEFTTKVRGGENVLGDMAIVGFDGATVYYGGSWTGGVLPTSPADHTARIYSRHDTSNLYLLMRVDDTDVRYSNPVDVNWANDCVEIYIDPSHDHGPNPISNSTSDIQLVIDANGQKNVYACTDTYKTQVLAGLTSVVLRDSSGWWLEMRITKSALDSDMPTSGSIGLDFCFRDNDNDNDPTQTTVYSWRDNSTGGGFPSKIPDKWGDAIMADVTAPAAVTGFAATPGDQQISLSWTNPSDSDFSGTLLRYKTGSYPISVTDGTLAIDKAGSPGAAGSHTQTGLTNGTRYYFSAWARDGLNNYSTKVNANTIPADAGPPGPVTAFSVVVGNERNNLSWTNPTSADFEGVKILAKTTGYPASQTDGSTVYDGVGTSCVHESLTNGTTYYYCAYAYDEIPNYSGAAQATGVPMRYDPLNAKLEPNDTEATITVGVVTCAWPGGFYIQCPDDSGAIGGIRVDMAGHGLSPGQSAGAKGSIGTDPLTDEKRITATWAGANASVYTASPVAVSGSSLGGSDLSYNPVTGAGQEGIAGAGGLNNIGVAVRVFGIVTQRQTSDPKYFYVDDGSGLKDGTLTGGTENVGVRIVADPASWAEGGYVVVTGVSSCFKDGGPLKREVAPVEGGIQVLGE
ncbi:MAG: sugar-binding protein [Armatimonadota bacterium]|nr:sugar-binding protein [Armatimonadota bacterium]